MQVEQKIKELMYDLDHKSEHKFQHIHGDCNFVHFNNCFKHVTIDGLWMEFGVYQGKTISTIAGCNPDKTVYGFDSFEGLPEHWNEENPIGAYTLDGNIPSKILRGENVIHGQVTQDWNSNIVLIKGLFEDTLPDFIIKHPENVAFIHIDSDIYSSAKTILTMLKNKIVPGTVICFDDWVGYPAPDPKHSDNAHEVKAFAEFLIDTSYNVKPLSYQTCHRYSQVGFLIY